MSYFPPDDKIVFICLTWSWRPECRVNSATVCFILYISVASKTHSLGYDCPLFATWSWAPKLRIWIMKECQGHWTEFIWIFWSLAWVEQDEQCIKWHCLKWFVHQKLIITKTHIIIIFLIFIVRLRIIWSSWIICNLNSNFKNNNKNTSYATTTSHRNQNVLGQKWSGASSHCGLSYCFYQFSVSS